MKTLSKKESLNLGKIPFFTTIIDNQVGGKGFLFYAFSLTWVNYTMNKGFFSLTTV